MTEQTPQELAESAIERKSFNFAATVQDRAYPEVKVPIYLDEDEALQLIEIGEQLNQLDVDIARAKGDRKIALVGKQVELVKRRDALAEKLRGEAYTVTVRGISTEAIEALQEQADAAFPTEVEEVVSPITGATSKVEKPNPKQERYFTSLLRHAHIVSIVDPSGAVADPMTVDELAATWSRMPVAARVRIDQAINKCSIAADIYRELVDEVF